MRWWNIELKKILFLNHQTNESGNINGPHNDAVPKPQGIPETTKNDVQQPKKTPMCLEDIISLSFGGLQRCGNLKGGKLFFNNKLCKVGSLIWLVFPQGENLWVVRQVVQNCRQLEHRIPAQCLGFQQVCFWVTGKDKCVLGRWNGDEVGNHGWAIPKSVFFFFFQILGCGEI